MFLVPFPNSKEDMMEWWNNVRMLCAWYSVASEWMERSGLLAAVVRAAGYIIGSNVQEEDEEGVSVDNLHNEGTGEDGHPPSYLIMLCVHSFVLIVSFADFWY
jgi:hypothetical protein